MDGFDLVKRCASAADGLLVVTMDHKRHNIEPLKGLAYANSR